MTKDEAKKQLDALCSVAKEVGLVINAGKRKLLSKNIDPKPEIKHDETVLEMEDDFQFLGACINDAMKDFKHWRAKIWTAFWKLKKIRHSNAGIKLKIKVLQCISSQCSSLCYRNICN